MHSDPRCLCHQRRHSTPMTLLFLLIIANSLGTASPAHVRLDNNGIGMKHTKRQSETASEDIIIGQMRQAVDYFIEHESSEQRDDCGWEHAAFMQGVMAVYNLTQDQKYKDYALTWAQNHQFETCDYPDTLKKYAAANYESCVQTYAELYLLDHNDTYIANSRDVLAVQVNRSQVDDWWWVDAYFMAMGAFSRIGEW